MVISDRSVPPPTHINLIPGSIRIAITLPVCKILKLLAPLKRTRVWCQGRLRQKLFIRVGNPGAFSYLSPHSDGNLGMAGRGQVDNWASWIRKGDQHDFFYQFIPMYLGAGG